VKSTGSEEKVVEPSDVKSTGSEEKVVEPSDVKSTGSEEKIVEPSDVKSTGSEEKVGPDLNETGMYDDDFELSSDEGSSRSDD